MEQITLTRKELYELIWSESMLSLSKRYRISDVGLRKMCRRLEVPVPPAGHWAKVQHGRKVKRPPLQGHYAGTERVKLQLRSETEAPPNRREPSSRKAKFRQLEIDNSLPLRVPEKLTKPDPLIIAAKAMLATAKPDSYTFIGMISSGKETLDIRVTKGNIGRSLLFMDTLIKALRGCLKLVG